MKKHRSFSFIGLLVLTMITSALENYKVSIVTDLQVQKSLNQTLLSREKRYSCDIIEALDVLENGLKVVANLPKAAVSTKNVRNYSEFVSSIVGLTKSIFSFNTPSICDVSEKLDSVLSKLTVMMEEISNLSPFIECKHIEQNYRDLSTKIKSLIGLFSHFHQTKRRDKARQAIISRCEDHERGIHEIYHMFTKLLEKEEVVVFLKNCAHYQSENVNLWTIKIKQTAFTIILLVQGCEEAYNGTTQFDPTRFMKEVEDFTLYYHEITNLKEFVKDKGNLGLRNIVKSIVNKAKPAEETVQILKKSFNYFNWDVIFYSSKTKVDDQHWLSHPNNTFCGSVVYRNELNGSRNALIAWCIPNNMDPDTIEFAIGENATHTVKWIRDKNEDLNKKLNYILVYRAPASKINNSDCNAQIMSVGGKIADRKMIREYWKWGLFPSKRSFCSFASWMTCSKEMDMPQFRLHGIILGIGEKVITRYDAKLEGHYKQLIVKSDYECFDECKYESECVAASFYAPWVRNCLFFREGFTKTKEPGWISYIKNDETIVNIPDIESNNDTRLFGHHYKEFISENDYKCFQKCKYEESCTAALFHALHLYNCYFFKEGFTKSTESNCASYIKNHTETINIEKTEKHKCNLDITIASNNDIRLFGGHYQRLTSQNDYSCFQECAYEAQCVAATFYASYTYNCFFFEEGFTQSVESNWTSYIKKRQMQGN